MKSGKKNRTFNAALLIIGALAITMTACSNSSGAEAGISAPDTNATDSAHPNVEHIVNPDRSLFVGETLTVAFVYTDVIAQRAASRYMRENPGTTIEIISYRDERERDGNFEMIREQIATQLMAGGGPVLMVDSLVDYGNSRSAHFFIDWFTFMDADPDFNEDDWFMNVFSAMSVKGRLLNFPLMIFYDMVVANKTIPGLSEALEAKESVTVSELFELHRSIPSEEQYFFDPRNASVERFVYYYISEFLDVEAGWADFDNARFIEFLNAARDNDNPNEQTYLSNIVSFREEAALSENYVFLFTTNYNWQYAHDYEEALFTGLTPVVNEKGEMRLRPFESLVLNANASPVQHALAWDFVQFLVQYYDYVDLLSPNRIHQRSGGERYVTELMQGSFMADQGWRLERPMEEAVKDVVSKMASFGDMPMFNARGIPDAISNVIDEALRNFNSGLVSAEQTAVDLQNKIELILMEISR